MKMIILPLLLGLLLCGCAKPEMQIETEAPELTQSTGDMLDMYVENVIAGIRTGKFMYVAHPDLPVYVGDDKDVVLFEAYNQICSVAKELNIPLEINVLGHMRGKYYPSDNFFKVAAEHKNDVIIGMDIHNPKHFHKKDDVEFCVRLAEKYNLNLLSEIKMI